MKIVYNTILFTLLFLATSCDHSEKIDDIKLEISQNIFRNIDNNTVCVVYQRNNGGYGLIETEE